MSLFSSKDQTFLKIGRQEAKRRSLRELAVGCRSKRSRQRPAVRTLNKRRDEDISLAKKKFHEMRRYVQTKDQDGIEARRNSVRLILVELQDAVDVKELEVLAQFFGKWFCG
jgi:uncharacterized coiled-coil DUF342 family protein